MRLRAAARLYQICRHGRALLHRNWAGAQDRVRVFEAAFVDFFLDVSEAPRVDDRAGGVFGFELLAGEDIDPDVAAIGESVYRQVALGDDDEAGDSPVFGLHADVA